MTDDLLRDLSDAASDRTGSDFGRLLRYAREEIERCHERLEIDRTYTVSATGVTLSNPVPYAERIALPDGIECRNETIKGLEKTIAGARYQPLSRMTPREYAAIHIAAGMNDDDCPPEKTAAWAVKVADALLAELERTANEPVGAEGEP